MPAIKPFAVLPLALSGITTGNAKTNRPATHLGLPQFAGMRWESDGSANLWVRGQFTGTQAVDFVSVMAANAQPGTTIRVRLGTTQAQVDGTAPYDSGAVTFINPARTEASGLYHSHLEIGSIHNASWWRIDIAGHTGDFSASALVFGTRRQSARFYNRDREFGFEDLGAFEIARNGVVADTPGAVLRTLLFRLQWVSDEEWFTLWEPFGLRNSNGSKRVIYWCFDSDPTVRRQAKSYLGFMARDPFLRGNDFPLWNQMDVQFRAFDFGSGQSASWTPASLFAASEGGWWLDPSDLNTMFQDSAGTTPVTAAGQPVGRILDKSGRGNHFIQATSGRRPTLQLDGTGRFYLEGDGTDDIMQPASAVAAGSSASAQMIVGLRTGTLAGAIPFATSAAISAGGDTPSGAQGTMGLRLVAFASSTNMVMSGVNRINISGSAIANTSYVYSLLGDIAGPSMTLRKNAVVEASSAASLGGGTFNNTTPSLFADSPGAQHFPGRIYQAICRFGPNLSVEDRGLVEAFVADKIGVTLP